jgi:thiol-disulfide isomerase/thioredoxin
LAVTVAVAALVAGYLTSIWIQKPVPSQDAAEVLLATTLPDLRGERQAILQWKGKVLVVNFWATWCPPCLKEIPEFIRLQEKMRDRGVQFVGIAIDDQQKVAKFAADLGINYPVLMAEVEGITLARQAGNRLGGLPFTVIIDRQGRTAKIELGVLDERKLLPILQGLL